MPFSPTVVSLFSGGGGLDLGLAAAGFDIRFESDIDPISCSTLKDNGTIAGENGLPGLAHAQTLQCDIRELDGSSILKLLDLKRGQVDVLAGGPPCQAFSVFGKRKGTGDQRGQLSFEYKRMLGELLPKVFVFENVAGLLTVEHGETYRRLTQELSHPLPDSEYVLFSSRVNARDFFVPQNRDRVIIVGVRKDICENNNIETFALTPCAFEEPSDDQHRWRTVSDAFVGLPDLPPNAPASTLIANHHGRRHSTRIIDRYKALEYGERDGHTRINRLDPNKPSYTIVVGSDAGGGKGHVHPFQPREVTPRESARIQTFPDWWVFNGTVRDEIRQIGNAVPSLLGFATGNAIREIVFNLQPVPLGIGLERLGQTHLITQR